MVYKISSLLLSYVEKFHKFMYNQCGGLNEKEINNKFGNVVIA